MKMNISIPSFHAIVKKELKRGKRAVTRGVHHTGGDMKIAFRRVVAHSGLGGKRLQNSIRGKAYPKGRDSFHPAYVISSSAYKIFRAHGQGASIEPRQKKYILVPLPAAGKKRLSPEEWEAKHGAKLHFVKTGPRRGALMASGLRVNTKGRAVKSRAKNKALHKSVPIFALMPRVKLTPKRLNFRQAATQVLRKAPRRIVAEWGKISP